MNFRSLPKAQLGLFKTGPIMMPRVISTINTGLNNLVNYFSGEEDKPSVESNPQLSIYDQMLNLYNEKYLDFANQFKKNNTSYITQNPTYINLTAGRFNTGKVPSYTIDATIASAQRQGIPIGKALALIGRESGFGVGPKANQWRAGNLQGLASSWNPAKDLNYHPYELMRFLADRQVPGIKTIKNDYGWFYKYDDKTGGQKAMIEYVNSHPNLLNRYKKIIDKTKQLGNLTAIDLGLMKMRRDGVANYNPGDERYEGMYNLDYDLLKKDPALQQYLKSKGLVYRKGGLLNQSDQKNTGGLIKAQEGLLNVTPINYQKIYDEERAKKISWLEGRKNHPNKVLQQEASEVLSQLQSYPEKINNIEFLPYFNLNLRGVSGRFDSRDNKILLTDPNKLFPDRPDSWQRSEIRRIKKDPERYAAFIKGHQEANTPQVVGHEIQHYLDKPAQNVIGRHNKDIFNLYDKKKYAEQYKKDFNPESPMEIPSSFNYFTGTSFVQGQFGKNYKNMFNYEMKRALDDLRTTYGIDPSKDSTPEEMESIKNKLYEKFFDKSLDEKERQRIDFMLELFRTTGGSKGVSDLNNIVVKNEGVSLPIGPQFSRKGGEIEEDKEMVEGIADILSQVKNRENRNQIAQNMIGDFKRENVKYDLNKFLSMANLMKKGGQMIKRADGSYSRRGLWDNIRANSGSGKKPTPEMLEQERKIRRESKEIGGIFMGQKLFRPRKSSIFATGGLTPLQAYDFLFGEEDEYTGNSAPDMSEVNTLKDENKKLAESLEQQNEINERLNRKLRMSNSYNAAMDEVNRPFVYNQDDNKDYDYSIIDDDPSAWDWDNTGSGPLNQNNKSGNQNSGLSWRQAPIGNYKEDLGVLFNPNVGVRITSGFKFREMDKKFHYGVDIGVPMNTEIYSPVDGVVSNVWTTGKGGLQLSIRAATGERFGFAHLNKTDLKIGDQISKRQFVGMSGTGGTGPHLHFTVTDANGKKVDPVKYFGHGAWNMADHVPQYKSSKK